MDSESTVFKESTSITNADDHKCPLQLQSNNRTLLYCNSFMGNTPKRNTRSTLQLIVDLHKDLSDGFYTLMELIQSTFIRDRAEWDDYQVFLVGQTSAYLIYSQQSFDDRLDKAQPLKNSKFLFEIIIVHKRVLGEFLQLSFPEDLGSRSLFPDTGRDIEEIPSSLTRGSPTSISTPGPTPFPSAPRFLASSSLKDKKKLHLLIACTGSIATIKLPLILEGFIPHSSDISIQVILTPSSINFLPPTYCTLYPNVAIPKAFPALVTHCWTNEDEWTQWENIGDPVLHIELRKWADILVISPLSADFMAKMVNGHVDGLLGGVVRAWDTKKNIYVAPAMNTFMWDNPLTGKHLQELHKWEWVKFWMPVEKKLACGDVGKGAMVEWSFIVKEIVKECLSQREDLKKTLNSARYH